MWDKAGRLRIPEVVLGWSLQSQIHSVISWGGQSRVGMVYHQQNNLPQ